MIASGIVYIFVLIILCSIIIVLEKNYKGKIFNYIPGIVILYFVTMILSNLGLWESNEEITGVYNTVKGSLLPCLIFLMLLRCDLREIVKLGPKMIIGFFASSISIAIGFIITYIMFKGFYEPETWKSFSVLCGTWMGGAGNMVAIQEALRVDDTKMGYALLMDSVNYSVWVMLLLSSVPFASKFNKWTKADTKLIDKIGKNLNNKNIKTKKINIIDTLILLIVGFMVSTVSLKIGMIMPETDFLNSSSWAILISTILGILGALTKLGKLAGSSQISNIMLYIIVSLIASRANFGDLQSAHIYIISGFVILSIHGIVLILFAKIFKLDLFTCEVASLANVGGVASAPILAGTYNENLVPVGVLMALMGYIIGTGGGLLVGKILSII